MSFTAKQIEGGVVEKKEIPLHEDYAEALAIGFNNGIDAQSSVPLEFDREGLAKLAYKPDEDFFGIPWEKTNDAVKMEIYKIADAIINAPINTVLKVGR